MKRLVILAVLSCSCWFVPAALGTGGASIAAAPTVTYGQQEFGNTATDDPGGSCNWNATLTEGFSWWQLRVTAGDHLTIDYQAEFHNFSPLDENVYPVGTSDFDFAQTNSTDQTNNSRDGVHGQEMFTAIRSGLMPLLFDNADCIEGGGGPYSFTAYVQHALVLGQSHSSNRHRHLTHFSIAVHDPDGVAISNPALRMTVVAGNRSRTFAQPFAFNVGWNRRQRGKLQVVHITVGGPSYRTSSTTVTVSAV